MFGESGKALGQFGWIHEIACPMENELYVAELLNWRVQKLMLEPTRQRSDSTAWTQQPGTSSLTVTSGRPCPPALAKDFYASGRSRRWHPDRIQPCLRPPLIEGTLSQPP
jgi:hypothetical protein